MENEWISRQLFIWKKVVLVNKFLKAILINIFTAIVTAINKDSEG